MWESPVISVPSLKDEDRLRLYSDTGNDELISINNRIGIHQRGLMYSVVEFSVPPTYPISQPEVSVYFSRFESICEIYVYAVFRIKRKYC